MRTTCALFCVLAMLGPVAATARAAAAKDESVEFLHLLQKEGFGDEAVDYLNQLKDDPNAPKEITDLWDLEMSRSKSEAAKHAYSPSEAKQYNEESKAYLDKFVKAHPDRPEAIQEEARVAEERAAEGQLAVIRRSTAPTRRKRPSSWPRPARSSTRSGRASWMPQRPRPLCWPSCRSSPPPGARIPGERSS